MGWIQQAETQLLHGGTAGSLLFQFLILLHLTKQWKTGLILRFC